TNAEGVFLLAANFNSGKIDVFDRNFGATHLAGNLTDPSLPAGYAPHGIKVINNVIFVAYAMQDSAKHDPMLGTGLGIIDEFDIEGNFHGTFTSGGTLNAPWGMVATPASFGDFSNAILIGNFGDGTMNAYDRTGHFLGQVKDSAGHVIGNPGLWDLVFGFGGTGDPGTLYFTAGGADQTSGLFATLVPAAVVGGPDFSLNLSSRSITVTAGGSTALTIGSAAVGGFNGQISLSCAPAAGLTCNFNPSTISPGSSAASAMLTLSATASAPGGGYGHPGVLLFSGLGIFGTLLFANGRKGSAVNHKALMLIAGLALLATGMTFTVACGNNPNHMATGNQANLTITGTSGGLSHSVPVSVTIH
ncbi:MAG TPA: TIGR03118 family protein, partial [Candidatus Sulfotelmatobacter sp.]|nr:TIGR03118 family protein [Candidatus Sulfotelmatobacter sp.]